MRERMTDPSLQELFYAAVRPFNWHKLNFDPVFHNTLDETFACSIGGVCLAGIEKLYGMNGIIYDFFQSFKVGEKQMCPFVSGKTPAKADYQGIGID